MTTEESKQLLKDNMEPIYGALDIDMSDKIIVHMCSCSECEWKVVSYSKDLALSALVEHMTYDHRKQLVETLKNLDNVDQVLIDALTFPQSGLSRRVFHTNTTAHAIPIKIWVTMSDAVFL